MKYRLYFIQKRVYLKSFTMRIEGPCFTHATENEKALELERIVWEHMLALHPMLSTGTSLVKVD